MAGGLLPAAPCEQTHCPGWVEQWSKWCRNIPATWSCSCLGNQRLCLRLKAESSFAWWLETALINIFGKSWLAQLLEQSDCDNTCLPLKYVGKQQGNKNRFFFLNCTIGNRNMPTEKKKPITRIFAVWEEAACFNNDSQYDQRWSNLSAQIFAVNNPSCPLKTTSNSITAGFRAQQIALHKTSEGLGRIKYKVIFCRKPTIHNQLYYA